MQRFISLLNQYLEWWFDFICMLKSSLLAFTRIQYDYIIRIGCQEKELYVEDRKLYKHDHFIVRRNNSSCTDTPILVARVGAAGISVSEKTVLLVQFSVLHVQLCVWTACSNYVVIYSMHVKANKLLFNMNIESMHQSKYFQCDRHVHGFQDCNVSSADSINICNGGLIVYAC